MREVLPLHDLQSFLTALEDPSLSRENREAPLLTSKMIVDATRYDAKNLSTVCLPATEAIEKAERLGIPLRK